MMYGLCHGTERILPLYSFLARPSTQPRSFEPTHLLRPSLSFRERDLGALFRVREAALALYRGGPPVVVCGLTLLWAPGGWYGGGWGGGGGGGGGGVGSFDDSVGVDGFGRRCCGWWRSAGGWWRAGLDVEL